MLLHRGGAVVRQQWARYRRSGGPSAAVQVVQSLPRYASTSSAASASRFHNDDYTTSPSSSINSREKGKERALEYSDGTPRQLTEKEREMQESAASFERLGLNAKLSKQLVAAFYPSIRSPTSTQQAILSAVRQNNDMIIRAHTGTGKSFGLLLALLSKPRIVIRGEKKSSPSGHGAGAGADDEENSVKSKRIASIVVVPSQELAKQYERWTRRLFPASLHHTLPSALAVKYREKGVSIEQHLDDLLDNPPHILVITAGLLNDLLTAHGGASVLGINTLRTLVLDEVDALLSLPGRFPSAKLVWNHLKHPPDGLEALNKIMKSRATFSGGEPLPSMGLEEKKTTSSSAATSSGIRRRAHQGNDLLRERASSKGKGDFTLSPPRIPLINEKPLQLIAVSATANSVLRHFLGARTGWLRTGLREGDNRSETGKWLDMTGLSQGINKAAEVTNSHGYSQSGWAFQLPKELKHSCIVVDEPSGQGFGEEAETNWRELKPKVVRNSRSHSDKEGRGTTRSERSSSPSSGKPAGPIIVAPAVASSPSLDEHLLLCLAFQFASQPVSRGLALIPAGWSLTKARTFLVALDIPVRFLNEQEKSASIIINEERGEAKQSPPSLYLIQANSVRGIDVPGGVSHVFCLGIESVQDAVNYTHLAGRASRIGGQNLDATAGGGSHSRPPGHVITLLRGVNADQARQNQRANKLLTIASSELKMSLIYKSLDLRPQKMDTDEESLRYAQISEEEEEEEEEEEGRKEGQVEEVAAAEVEAEEGETKEVEAEEGETKEVGAEVDEVLEKAATETEPEEEDIKAEKEAEREKEPPSASTTASS